jgi:putative methionine-R-sulfoxide reductase with GAF domain
MEGNLEFGPERRRCLRQKVHAPAFASFDGVTGGMILDLSEEGLSMQTTRGLDNQPLDGFLDKGRRVRMELDLSEPDARLTPSKLETTGYIAWADALGRAGVRFSDLPEEARRRLNEWLTVNAGAPSHTAPKVALGWPRAAAAAARLEGRAGRDHAAVDHVSISLEAEMEAGDGAAENGDLHPGSATVQYEFSSLGTDLTAALRLIGERARALTRGTSAAIALVHKGRVMCRASVGESAPALGTRLDVNCGLAGECFREGKTLRCDDAEHDPRVNLESCRRLGVRSIVAAPVRYERDTVGLVMVFAKEPFNFDEGDVAVVESLAHTVVRSMRQADAS